MVRKESPARRRNTMGPMVSGTDRTDSPVGVEPRSRRPHRARPGRRRVPSTGVSCTRASRSSAPDAARRLVIFGQWSWQPRCGLVGRVYPLRSPAGVGFSTARLATHLVDGASRYRYASSGWSRAASLP